MSRPNCDIAGCSSEAALVATPLRGLDSTKFVCKGHVKGFRKTCFIDPFPADVIDRAVRSREREVKALLGE